MCVRVGGAEGPGWDSLLVHLCPFRQRHWGSKCGRIREADEVVQPDSPGTMLGRIKVHAWDPTAGNTHTWFETVDQQGTVRIVRPETGGPKVPFLFDAGGNYVGTR